MTKLISMTDFCLEILDENPPYNEFLMLTKISNYATFLKQPLKLEMFVPCDGDGNPMEKPIETIGGVERYTEKYKKAKAKVLFEGFELKGETDESWLFSINDIFPNIIYKESTIERLLIYKSKIKLTESAIKQITN